MAARRSAATKVINEASFEVFTEGNKRSLIRKDLISAYLCDW